MKKIQSQPSLNKLVQVKSPKTELKPDLKADLKPDLKADLKPDFQRSDGSQTPQEIQYSSKHEKESLHLP